MNPLFKKLSIFILFVRIAAQINAQDMIGLSADTTLSIDYLGIAEVLYDDKRYYEAIYYYEMASRHYMHRKNYEIVQKLGNCYAISRLYPDAARVYAMLYKKAGKTYPQSLFHLARMQQSMGLYKKAESSFNLYIKNNKTPEDLYKKSINEAQACKNISLLYADSNYQHAFILPKEVNKNPSNYGSYFAHGGLWYSSSLGIFKNVEDSIAKTRAVYDKTYMDRIFYAPKKDSIWNTGWALENLIYSKTSNYLPVTFSPDQKTIYASICRKTGKQNCYIYASPFTLGKEVSLEWIEEPVNNSKFSTRDPSLVLIDGKQVLFFASKRESKNFDLYYSILDNEGTPSEIKLLGGKINSTDDETSPFYDAATKTLFFASNGHQGMGSFDVFSVTGDPFSGWGEVKNAGYPINTSADDYYYYQHTTPDTIVGYVSSNRLASELCCDKIYEIKKTAQNIALKINVTGCKSTNPLNNFKVDYCQNGFKENYKTVESENQSNIEFTINKDYVHQFKIYKQGYDTATYNILHPQKDSSINIQLHVKNVVINGSIVTEETNKPVKKGMIYFLNDATREVLDSVKASETGTFQLKVPVDFACEAEISGKLRMMKNMMITLTPEDICNETAEMIFKLPKMDIGASILKHKIEFKTNSADVKETSYPELDRLAKFIIDNPDIKLEVAGHTDNVGKYEYNLMLSQKRAESINKYLLSKGVSPTKLTAQGYSFSQPITTNDTPEGRTQNRRVEFKVIEIDEDKLIDSF